MQRYVIICHLIEGPAGSVVSTVNMEGSRAKVQKCPVPGEGSRSYRPRIYRPPASRRDDGEVSMPRRPAKHAGVHKQRVARRPSRSVTSFTHAVATGLHTCDCVFNPESPETLKDSRAASILLSQHVLPWRKHIFQHAQTTAGKQPSPMSPLPPPRSPNNNCVMAIRAWRIVFTRAPSDAGASPVSAKGYWRNPLAASTTLTVV